MAFSVSEAITKKLVSSEIISPDESEIYSFGLHNGIILLLNLITVLAIGFVFNMVLEVIIFLLAYSPLRTYAGGYHAKTQLRCYFMSIVIIIAVLITIKYVPMNNLVYLLCLLSSSTIIFLLAPVQDQNKPLNEKEKIVYGRRSYIILSILIALFFLLAFIGQAKISVCIAMGIAVLAIMLVLGKVKNAIKGV